MAFENEDDSDFAYQNGEYDNEVDEYGNWNTAKMF